MNFSSYLSMDPHLLCGLLNTALRNDHESLQDLVKTHNLDEEALDEKMSGAGYQYRPELHQFRASSQKES
ncbi:MAG: DUF4250 domain-containing protein [Verrucomicrobiota bacterium]